MWRKEPRRSVIFCCAGAWTIGNGRIGGIPNVILLWILVIARPPCCSEAPDVDAGKLRGVMSSIAAVAVGGIALAGGSGSYFGAVIGRVLLTTLSSILVALQTTEAIRQIVYGGLLFFIVVIHTRRAKE